MQERSTVKCMHQQQRLAATHAQVTMPNEIPTPSQRSRLSLHNPEIHSCYWNSTSESTLTSQYGTRRSHNGLVVGYDLHMGDDRTGSAARTHLGAHLPAANRRWRLVDQGTLTEITSRVNKRIWTRVNQCTLRWNDKRTQKTTTWIPRQVTSSTPGERVEGIPGGKPARNWRWYGHRAPGGYQVYLQVHRLGGWSVRLQEHRSNDGKIKQVWSMPNEYIYVYWSSSEHDRKWTPNILNSLPNGIATHS
jgi:hypothetical protein